MKLMLKERLLRILFYEKTIELQVQGKKEERTGEVDSDIYLEIMGKKIYLKSLLKSLISMIK